MNTTDTPRPSEPEIVTLATVPVAVVREVVPMSELTGFFGPVYETVAEALGRQHITMTGPPLAIYHGMPSDTVDVAAGFPTDRPVDADNGVVAETLPGGRAAQIVHVGSYDSLQQSYGRLMAWLEDQKLAPGPIMWESYLTEPAPDGDQRDMLTRITWPLAE
jgi:effector-binding domain-containing protein